MELNEGQMMELLVRRLALAQLAMHRAHLVIYTLQSKAVMSPNYLVSLVAKLLFYCPKDLGRKQELLLSVLI